MAFTFACMLAGTNVHALIQGSCAGAVPAPGLPAVKALPLASRTMAGLQVLADAIRGCPGSVCGPLLQYANSVGADAGRLSARGILADGELRSAQAPSAAPVWFLFTGQFQGP